LTQKTIQQYYWEGLLFALPFVCFGIVTFLTVSGNLKKVTSTAITLILITVLGFTSIVKLVSIAFETSMEITDISKYERVLSFTGDPNDPLTNFFPEKIPDDARNIEFSYIPAFMHLSLRFETDKASIEKYSNKFSNKAIWIGKPDGSEAEKYGVISVFDYKDLPSDLTIYVIYSRPYHPNDWNHGARSLIAISKQKNEILFLADSW